MSLFLKTLLLVLLVSVYVIFSKNSIFIAVWEVMYFSKASAKVSTFSIRSNFFANFFR